MDGGDWKVAAFVDHIKSMNGRRIVEEIVESDVGVKK